MASKFDRVFVLGIDGVPYTLIERFCAEGIMPNLSKLHAANPPAQIDSVLPTVSNVAWACFQTGKGPGKFNIFGFVEVGRNMELRLPNAADLKSLTVQEIASAAGKRVISLGVPSSYPPREINGLMVGGFLAPQLAKAVHPPERLSQLQQLGYQLDIDPMKARQDVGYLKQAALQAFNGRRKTTEALLAEDDWDLFILHVMDTDRVNHFMWRLWEENSPGDKEFFEDFYRQVDDFIGYLTGKLGQRDLLVIMSDHGFCLIRHEVELNRWLMAQGYLKLSGDPMAEMFGAISDDSKAFALVPGRIHLLAKETFGRGSVTAENYESTRDEIIAKLAQLRDPQTDEPICQRILKREEAFTGPYTSQGPDIIVDPHDGYDLKASLGPGDVFSSSPITGMHTYHDAYLMAHGAELTSRRRSVTDVTRSILEALSVPVPADMDSQGILA